MTKLYVSFLLSMLPALACAQSRPDLYECEGCEAIHERSFQGLTWSAAVAPPGERGARMVVGGVVFKPDGKTPAPGVILYVHQTNAEGVYPMRGDETGWGRRHGYLRAWVKTNDKGEYRFDTIRPGTYPSRVDPAHIHFIVKEPDRREYWIDDVVFTDDPLVNERYRSRLQNRGGSGIVTPVQDNGVWQVRRDIVLER